MEGNTGSDLVSSQGCDSCLGTRMLGAGRGGSLSSLGAILVCVVCLCV